VKLEELDLRAYISEPDRGRRKWTARRAEEQALKRREQAAVYRNRRRRRGRRSKALHRKRVQLVGRSFEHVLDDGGTRRVYLRGRENIAKRYPRPHGCHSVTVSADQRYCHVVGRFCNNAKVADDGAIRPVSRPLVRYSFGPSGSAKPCS
jgi:hypothetical protein